MDDRKPNGAVRPEADAGDEAATRVASSPAPPSALSSEETESVPAGEPEAPVGPAAPAEEERTPEEERAREAEPDEDPADRAVVELTARAEKAEEYLELAQRTKADFENYRKRAAREAAAAQERGVVKLAKELLPAVDNLDRALEAAQASSNGEDLVSGIKLVHADVIAALGRVGIQAFSPEGEPFDPQHHEAVAQQPVEGAEPGTVVEVYQRGYRLGDSILRPARVLVAG